jgi:hypothetical protein
VPVVPVERGTLGRPEGVTLADRWVHHPLDLQLVEEPLRHVYGTLEFRKRITLDNTFGALSSGVTVGTTHAVSSAKAFLAPDSSELQTIEAAEMRIYQLLVAEPLVVDARNHLADSDLPHRWEEVVAPLRR